MKRQIFFKRKTMNSDEEFEVENDRSRLLTKTDTEPKIKLHEDVARYVLATSESESCHGENLEESEKGKVTLKLTKDIGFGVKTKSMFCCPIPKRFIVLILMALGNFNMYCVRMCLNVTIVAMTSVTEQNSNGTLIAQSSKTPEFNWDKEMQGTLLACLYWGYTATQIPAGILSYKFGGTFLLGFAVFSSSILTLATPFVIRRNVNGFILLRILEGLFLGLVGSSSSMIVSKWAPVYERSIFQTVSYAGLLSGTVFANTMSGILADSAWGWPSVFYFFGFLGILWYFLWIYFIYEEPSDHPNITKAELGLIGKHWNSNGKMSIKQIPWRYILTSVPVLALVINNFTDCWCFYTFMISSPLYLHDVLKFDVTKIGFASSLPYVFCLVISPLWGYTVDMLRSKRYITTIVARRLSSFIGNGVSSLFIIGIGYTTTSSAALILVTIAISLSAFATSGAPVNLVEIAPKYSSILMGIINFACNVTGFICPQVVGVLTGHGGDPFQQWRLVFFITGGLNIFGMFVYCSLASAEKQAWAEH